MPEQLSDPIKFCHAADDDHAACLEVDCVFHGEFHELIQCNETGIFFCPECGSHKLDVEILHES
ncbi:hypothetical protein [Pseudoalteromonas ruthenica]|uniref:hypothetical protein n=1 Tax=Pseudoalteromonas ruthenica TaxID=151081 RepID=UPI00110A38CA|nr:hypothetical protein [Pseudoalteromonas ruthenica]TMO97567.1 hypothetical protein CWC07_13885 [Pseudoalteromonas ruthenica]